MIIHKDSHTDHAINAAQWHHILDLFEGRTGFFIETIELPRSLGFVLNELYGPSCGDLPVPEAEVHYARRGDRTWNSRLVKAPKRPTRFVRVIAGPHETMKCPTCGVETSHKFHSAAQAWCEPCDRVFESQFPCVLYTAYGVSNKDMPAAPKEPGDIVAQLEALAATDPTSTYEVDAKALRDKLRESQRFWDQHALATEAY